MRILLAMVRKDLKLLFRDKVTVFFTFGFPLIFAAFFGSIISGGAGESSGMPVAVSDLDQSAESAAFVQRMVEMSEFEVEVLPEQNAREAARRGRKVAYIILPEGFGKAYGSLFSGGTPQLTVGADPSRQAEAGMLQGVLMQMGIERFENAGGDSFSGIAEALMPLNLNFEAVATERDGPRNGYSITIPQAMYWAMMGVVMGFGVALVQERTWGTMTRLVVAPLTRMQILGGKAAGCYFALLIVMTILFAFASLVFRVPIEHPLKVALALVCVSTGFVGLMMFLAAIGKTQRGMASLGWGVMMVFAMFGGAMIPLFAMPDWMKTISHLSPVKWAILSFEGATWRGFTYAELMLPLGIMLVLGVVLFVAGSRLLKLED